MYEIKILTRMPKLLQSTISTVKTVGIVFLTKYFTMYNSKFSYQGIANSKFFEIRDNYHLFKQGIVLPTSNMLCNKKYIIKFMFIKNSILGSKAAKKMLFCCVSLQYYIIKFANIDYTVKPV